MTQNLNPDYCQQMFALIVEAGRSNPNNDKAYEAGSHLLREITACDACEHCPIKSGTCLLSTHPDAAGLMYDKRQIACKDTLTDEDRINLGDINGKLDAIERQCTCYIHTWANAWHSDYDPILAIMRDWETSQKNAVAIGRASGLIDATLQVGFITDAQADSLYKMIGL